MCTLYTVHCTLYNFLRRVVGFLKIPKILWLHFNSRDNFKILWPGSNSRDNFSCGKFQVKDIKLKQIHMFQKGLRDWTLTLDPCHPPNKEGQGHGVKNMIWAILSQFETISGRQFFSAHNTKGGPWCQKSDLTNFNLNYLIIIRNSEI